MSINRSFQKIAGIAILVTLLASACKAPGPIEPRDDEDDPRPPDQEAPAIVASLG